MPLYSKEAETSSADSFDAAELARARAEIMSFARAKNTLKSYKRGWKVFEQWCASAGRQALPSSPETVLDFVTYQIRARHHRLVTISAGLFAIRFFHQEASLISPVDAEVRRLVRTAARKLRERPRGKKALTLKHVQRISERLRASSAHIAARDLAMVLFGFAAGWRGSEIVSLNLRDVRFDGSRMILTLGASKTDQDGSQGRVVSIPRGGNSLTCPVQAMRRWLAIRGDKHGPLFCHFYRGGKVVPERGIGASEVNRRLKKLLRAIGENPEPFGSHSLRVGMITAAAENGSDAMAIMQRTGQKNVATVLRYIRPVEANRNDPLAGVL